MNKLTETIQGIRSHLETESRKIAAGLTTPATTISRARRITYVTTIYSGGSYVAAREKYDSLEKMPNVGDLSLDIVDESLKKYNVVAIIKSEGAWTEWS
jgi:hypothetical protein